MFKTCRYLPHKPTPLAQPQNQSQNPVKNALYLAIRIWLPITTAPQHFFINSFLGCKLSILFTLISDRGTVLSMSSQTNATFPSFATISPTFFTWERNRYLTWDYVVEIIEVLECVQIYCKCSSLFKNLGDVVRSCKC